MKQIKYFEQPEKDPDWVPPAKKKPDKKSEERDIFQEPNQRF